MVVSRTVGVCEWLPADVRFEVDLGDDDSIRLARSRAYVVGAPRGAASAADPFDADWAGAPSWIARSRSTHSVITHS